MDSVKWAMIWHIAVATRRNRTRYKEMFVHISLPKMRLSTSREITRFYQSEGLGR